MRVRTGLERNDVQRAAQSSAAGAATITAVTAVTAVGPLCNEVDQPDELWREWHKWTHLDELLTELLASALFVQLGRQS